MKCRGIRDTTSNIPRIVSRFPRYISWYTVENRLALGQCTVGCEARERVNKDECPMVHSSSLTLETLHQWIFRPIYTVTKNGQLGFKCVSIYVF